MMKTPDEIKKRLVEAIEETAWVVEGGDAHDLQDACDMAHASMADALDLIQRLERQKNEMWSNTLSMQDALTKQERVRSNLQERISQLEAQVPRWISVKERQPETQVDVLLFCKHESGGTDFVAVGSRAHWTPNRYYIGAVTTGIDADRITHWMPLPEPPKET